MNVNFVIPVTKKHCVSMPLTEILVPISNMYVILFVYSFLQLVKAQNQLFLCIKVEDDLNHDSSAGY